MILDAIISIVGAIADWFLLRDKKDKREVKG